MFESIIEKNKASAISIAGVVAANIVDDTKDFTIPVALPEEGQASINRIFNVPEYFNPGKSFYFTVEIFNLGSKDTIFFRVVNRDTDEVLYETTQVLSTGDVWQQYVQLTLIQTTDFHGRIEAGHEE